MRSLILLILLSFPTYSDILQAVVIKTIDFKNSRYYYTSIYGPGKVCKFDLPKALYNVGDTIWIKL